MQPQFPKLQAKLLDNGFTHLFDTEADWDCYRLEKHLLMGCFSTYNTCYTNAGGGFSKARIFITMLESDIRVKLVMGEKEYHPLNTPEANDFCQRFANCLAILARNEGLNRNPQIINKAA